MLRKLLPSRIYRYLALMGSLVAKASQFGGFALATEFTRQCVEPPAIADNAGVGNNAVHGTILPALRYYVSP